MTFILNLIFRRIGWQRFQTLPWKSREVVGRVAHAKSSDPATPPQKNWNVHLFRKTKTVHNHDTRDSTHGLNFSLNSQNLKFGQRSFASYGCRVWKHLDRDVEANEEPKRFKKALQETLLDKIKKWVHFPTRKLTGPLGEQKHMMYLKGYRHQTNLIWFHLIWFSISIQNFVDLFVCST